MLITEKSRINAHGRFAIFFPLGISHAQINNENFEYSRYCINFKESFIFEKHTVKNELTDCLKFLKSDDVIVIQLNDECFTNTVQYAQKIYEIFNTGGQSEISMLKCKYLIIMLLLEISSEINLNDIKSTEKTDYIYNVCLYLDENLSKPVSLDSTAEYFFVSRSKLMRDFKKSMNMTYNEYLTMLRLRYAKSMLQGGCSIQDIAYSCGFSCESYFIYVFRKLTGMTPRQYRDTIATYIKKQRS